MKYSAILPAALALAVGMTGVVQAQGTSTTTPPSTTTTPPPSAPTATPGTPMTTPGTGATAPSAMAPNGAQSNGAPVVSGTGSATNNAVNTKPQNNPGAPVPGANSFTQGEARRRIENHGFHQVTDLKLDRQGIWRGKANKNGKPVSVSMDYQGNVVSQ